MNRFPQWLMSIGLSFLLVSDFSSAQESAWSYSSGVDYSLGDYGSDSIDTAVTFIPFTLFYKGNVWDFNASFSHVTVDGVGTVLPGEGIIRDVPDRDLGAEATTESGVGDVWLSANRFINAVPQELFYLDLGVKVKIPIADEEKGLGTGEIDYTLQADFYKPIGEVMPFFTFSYKVRGDSEDYDLNNVMAISLGSDFTVSERTHIGVSLDYQEASYDTGEKNLELFGYLNQEINQRWTLMLYGYNGLADGSPDYGVGLQMAYAP